MNNFFNSEERKSPFIFYENFFKFSTNTDLSDIIKVEPIDKQNDLNYNDPNTMQKYSLDLSLFMFEFYTTNYNKLNGFSGLDTINFNF